MFTESKKIKLMVIVFGLLVICTIVGVLKHGKSSFDTRMIYSKIDIGGYGLFVNCNGTGKPTVIFESGLGGTKDEWAKLQTEISKTARTFSYDRAGLGVSDASKLKKSSLTQANELHTLLKNAKVNAPYIIVAHSIGGFNARLFAGTYPNEVAGIVFVDCTHENQLDDRMKISTPKEIEAWKNQYNGAELNLEEQMLSASGVKEIRKKDALRNIPITILTADHKGVDVFKGWKDYQKDLASLSNRSKQIYITNCGHYIHMERPQIVIDAIKELIKEVKN